MDVTESAVFRHRKSLLTDRYLGAYPHAPAQNTASAGDDELNEDDIFSTGDFSSSEHQSPPSSTSSTPRRHNHQNLHHYHKAAFPSLDSYGILAALPEKETVSIHHIYQKTTISPSSATTTATTTASSSSSSSSNSSSARLIPSIPKPPQERLPASASFSKFHHHMSAPVNVPVLSTATRRRGSDIDEIDEEEDDDGDGEMLPPHEMVARAQSPAVACSVFEGVGRTLKGRDLRQVRNAVWRRTGFID